MGASNGDQVKVHYTGRLEDGSVFDSSREREPLGFEMGAGMMIKGFEKAVSGMEVGQEVTATIPPEEAYGPYNPEMVVDMPLERVPADMKPELGQKLQLQAQDGQLMNVTVAEITDTSLKLDANHFLAGKTLIFDIEVMEIS